MYPKNKPLPAEAAGRAASATFKRGAEKAASDAAAGGVAGPSSLGAPVRLPQSDDNSRSTSSSHHSSRQNIPMKQASRPLATVPLPPAYQEGLRDGPLCEGSFHSDCMYNGGAPMVMPGGGIRGSSSHQFLQSAVPPPPYEESVPSASGLNDERAYDPLCGMGGAPQPPPPPPPSALLPPPPPPPHTVAPTGCVDSSYYDGRQLHQFAPPSMPPPPPWPSHEVGPPPPMPGTELPYYRDSNGMGQPQAPYMHLPRFPWAGPHFVQHKGKGEAGRMQLDENLSERKSDKSEEMEKFSEFLQSHQLSVMSNVSMKGQSDEQQQLLLSWMEKTKRFSQQHRHDVAFLTHLVMVLLERLTSIKCTVSATEAVNGGKGIEGNDGSIDAEEGDTPMVPSKDDDEDDGEVVALKQQLSELQDVLSSMEMEDSAMTPRRRNLLAGILALPQLLPLPTMALNCHEKSASSLADTESLADEKEALSRYMTTEVKTLMKAMDFETTRPLTLNVVAPSPPPPPRVDRCCATTIH